MSEMRAILIQETQLARKIKVAGREVWIPRSVTKRITKFPPDKGGHRECTLDVMANPTRIQLSRRAGFNLQEFSRELNGLPAINCARPSRYGNPVKIGAVIKSGPLKGQKITREEAIREFETSYLPDMVRVDPEFLKPLRGKNLACFCGLDEKCHVDILLREANK